MLDERDTRQQAAVGTTFNTEPPRIRHLARDEILRDGSEIVKDELPVHAEPGIVPLRAELATTADVGKHIYATFFQPQLAARRRIGRRLTDLEATIGIEQRRVAALELH